jgi:nucleoid-associated protein YgaU
MPRDDVSYRPQSSKEAKTDDVAYRPQSSEEAKTSVPYRPQSSKEAKTYVVQAGDSLSKIAKALLGDAARWPEIFELNKDQIKDPNLIYPGQELRLP